MSPYEPWRSLRKLDVPDGARARLLAGIDAGRARSRRGLVVVAVVGGAAAAVALAFALRSADAPVTAARPDPSPGDAVDRRPQTGEGAAAEPAADSPAIAGAPAAPGARGTAPVVDAPEPAGAAGDAGAAQSAPAAAPTPAREPRPRRRARSSRARSTFAGSEERQAQAATSTDLEIPSLLREQVRAFRAARVLAPAAALAAYREHRRTWPASNLRREVDLAIIEALRELGRTVEARGEAARFARSYPDDRRAAAMRRFAGDAR